MAVSLEIMDGIDRSIEQIQQKSDLDSDQAATIAECLRKIATAADACAKGYEETKAVPYEHLATFLNQSKTMKQILGDGMDKECTGVLRTALINAQLFDKDLETSLSNFKPKLLTVFLLGTPIHWLLGAGGALKKVRKASARLNRLAEKLGPEN